MISRQFKSCRAPRGMAACVGRICAATGGRGPAAGGGGVIWRSVRASCPHTQYESRVPRPFFWFAVASKRGLSTLRVTPRAPVLAGASPEERPGPRLSRRGLCDADGPSTDGPRAPAGAGRLDIYRNYNIAPYNIVSGYRPIRDASPMWLDVARTLGGRGLLFIDG